MWQILQLYSVETLRGRDKKENVAVGLQLVIYIKI